jgi:class 3 adenylate cyclase
VGDERAQGILRAHRQLLREALGSHGGREVKWLGDGLLTPFASVPMPDGCLSMACLCAPQRRHDEARDWFAKPAESWTSSAPARRAPSPSTTRR